MNKILKDLKYAEFANTCFEELQALQGSLTHEYEINSYENWFYNDAARMLWNTSGYDER